MGAVPKFQNLINGEWVDSVSGQTFQNLNPADTREIIGEFPESTQEDAARAVNCAAAAYQKWRLVPAPKRADILFHAAEMLGAEKSALSRDMTREMGKVLKETGGDVQEAIDMTYYI